MLHGILPFSHRDDPAYTPTRVTTHVQTWHDEFDLDAISPAKTNNARRLSRSRQQSVAGL